MQLNILFLKQFYPMFYKNKASFILNYMMRIKSVYAQEMILYDALLGEVHVR